MKKILNLLLVTVVVLGFTACSSDPSAKLIGKWKGEKSEIVNKQEVIDNMLKDVPDSLKESTKAQIETAMKDSEKLDITLTFNKDNSIETAMEGGNTEKGTWKMSEDKKAFIVTSNGKDDKAEIVELTDDKLIFALSNPDNNSKIKLHFNKVK